MAKDIFKSEPQEGAVVRDWCDETITLDLVNSIGERFHFEIKPGEVDNLRTAGSSAPSDRNAKNNKHAVFIQINLPILAA